MNAQIRPYGLLPLLPILAGAAGGSALLYSAQATGGAAGRSLRAWFAPAGGGGGGGSAPAAPMTPAAIQLLDRRLDDYNAAPAPPPSTEIPTWVWVAGGVVLVAGLSGALYRAGGPVRPRRRRYR